MRYALFGGKYERDVDCNFMGIRRASGCDERRYFRGMHDAYRIHPLEVPCDDVAVKRHSNVASIRYPIRTPTGVSEQLPGRASMVATLSGMLGDLLYWAPMLVPRPGQRVGVGGSA
jgi:hypothetical protein